MIEPRAAPVVGLGIAAVQPVKPAWDKDKAIQYLNTHTFAKSHGKCAEYTRRAIEAGGLTVKHTLHAKDYGSNLGAAGFQSIGQAVGGFLRGDVVVIQSIEGHPDGHMAMFNGAFWVSDFKQHNGLYPGKTYRKKRPHYTIYRYGDNRGSGASVSGGPH